MTKKEKAMAAREKGMAAYRLDIANGIVPEAALVRAIAYRIYLSRADRIKGLKRNLFSKGHVTLGRIGLATLLEYPTHQSIKRVSSENQPNTEGNRPRTKLPSRKSKQPRQQNSTRVAAATAILGRAWRVKGDA